MAKRKPLPAIHTLPGFWLLLGGIAAAIVLAALDYAGIGIGTGLIGVGIGFGMLGKARRWKGASGAGWVVAGIGVLVLVMVLVG